MYFYLTEYQGASSMQAHFSYFSEFFMMRINNGTSSMRIAWCLYMYVHSSVIIIQNVISCKYDISDSEHVGMLYKILTEKGLNVWWDKKCLKSGQPWEEGAYNLKSVSFFPLFLFESLHSFDWLFVCIYHTI